MRDDRLDALLGGLGAAEPASLAGPAAARARGEQRRRRGQALLAGTGAVLTALAVLAGSTLASPPDGPAQVLEPAPPTPAVREDPVRAALLDPEDVDPLLAGSWRARPLRDVPFPALPDDCSSRPFGTSAPQQGDTGTAQRHLDGSRDQVLAHAVLSYGDADRARSALDRLRAAVESCRGTRTLLTDDLEDAQAPRSTADRLYGLLYDEPDAAAWVVERVDRVLSAVRLQPGARIGDLPALADAAAAEVRSSGLLPPAPPTATAVPAPDVTGLLTAQDVARVRGDGWVAQPDRAGETSLLVSPCPAAVSAPEGLVRSIDPDPLDDGRRGVLSQALLLPDAEAAADALAQLRADLARCPSRPADSEDGAAVVEHALLDRGRADELGIARTQRDCPDCPGTVDHAGVVQVGPVLALVVVDDVEALAPLVDVVRARLAGAAVPASPPRTLTAADLAPAALDAADVGRLRGPDSYFTDPVASDAWLLAPCGDDARTAPEDESLGRRITPERDGGPDPGSVEVQLAGFPDAPAAAAALVALQAEVERCPARTGNGAEDLGHTDARVVEAPRYGDGSFHAELTVPCDGCAVPTLLDHVVLRVGRVLAVVRTVVLADRAEGSVLPYAERQAERLLVTGLG